jgi:hypothetical protein
MKPIRFWVLQALPLMTGKKPGKRWQRWQQAVSIKQ